MRRITAVLGIVIGVCSSGTAFASGTDATRVTPIRMRTDGAEIPLIEVMGGTGISPMEDSIIQVLLSFEFRGVEGRENGEYWANVFVEGGLDPTNPSNLAGARFRIEFTPYRKLSESDPVPVASETYWFPVEVSRDPRLSRELDATIHVLGFSGGLFLPATDPGDFEIMAAVAVEALGAKFRRYIDDAHPDFAGAELGGIQAEISAGVQLGQDWIVRGRFGGGVDVSLGASVPAGADARFSAVVDATVRLGFSVSYRRLVEFVITGGYTYSRDTGAGVSDDVLDILASLRFTF